jgi:hypothetical protein
MQRSSAACRASERARRARLDRASARGPGVRRSGSRGGAGRPRPRVSHRPAPELKALPAPPASGPLAFVDRDVVGSLITQDRGVYPSGGPGVQVTFARHAALYTLSTDAPALAAQLTALAVSWWSAAPVAFRDAPGAQIVVVGSAGGGCSSAW